MYWLVDFESYKALNEDYVVKEIAILSSDGRQCYNYRIKSPRHYPCPSNNATVNYQFLRHKIHWDEGDCTFYEALADIWVHLGGSIAYVKGLEKMRFLQRHLFRVGELHMVPSLKKLNSCISSWCTKRHGKFCARRKVHELRHYIHINGINLAE
jgi:hypothetical protein